MISHFTTTVNTLQRLWLLLPALLIISALSCAVEADNKKNVTYVGAIINLNSQMGIEQKTAMEIAAENFNNLSKTHVVVLHFRHSDRDPLLAALEAEELIKKNKVQVLIGMDTWQEAILVADVGNRAQIPVISFASLTINPPLMQRRWPFFIRLASNAAAQMKCIADIVATYSWKRVVVMYEYDGYELGMLALLSKALQDVGSKIEQELVLPQFSSLSNPSLVELEGLLKLPTFQSRVFIVLQSSLQTVTNIFRVSNKMGLVGPDSAWIITESVTNLLEPQANTDMEGTLGIKTYHPKSACYAEFEKAFQKKNPEGDESKPGVYALRAYDLIRTVTQAIEMKNKSTTNLGLLLNIVLKNYTGLSGKMHFEGGEVLYSPIFRIINIVEGNKYKDLDFWRPKVGFSESLAREGSKTRMGDVGRVIWPGNPSQRAPKGWGMPTAQKPMIIGVPASTAFSVFISVESRKNSADKYSGFCIEIFNKVLSLLNYTLEYEFKAFNGTYNELVEQVHNKTFDAAVGDITILSDRLDKVDFTQPYMESGLSLIVEKKSQQPTWVFTRPLSWQTWAVTGAIVVYTILIVWFLEHPSNPEFSGPLKNQIGTAIWFTFTSFFFTQREKIHNNLTRVVVIVWLFVVFILTSSYTASLSSILTIQGLKSNITDIEMLKRTNAKVGLDKESFMVNYLVDVLKFKEDNIIKIDTQEKFSQEFKLKDISAAFLELPYAKVFINNYCKEYTATTPTLRFGGLGFIFQKGSPFTQDFTKAILELMENGEVKSLENILLTPYHDCSNNTASGTPESLSVRNFIGLYVLSGATSTICLLLSFTMLLKKYQQHQEEYQYNANDGSVWEKTVRIARFLYNRELHIPSRSSSFDDVLELRSFQREGVITSTIDEDHLQTSMPVSMEDSAPHE